MKAFTDLDLHEEIPHVVTPDPGEPSEEAQALFFRVYQAGGSMTVNPEDPMIVELVRLGWATLNGTTLIIEEVVEMNEEDAGED